MSGSVPEFKLVFSGMKGDFPSSRERMCNSTPAGEAAAEAMQKAYMLVRYAERVGGINVDAIMPPLTGGVLQSYEKLGMEPSMGACMDKAINATDSGMVEEFDRKITERLDRHFPPQGKEQRVARGL